MSAIIRQMVMRKRAAACVAVAAQVNDDPVMKWRGQWQRSVEYVVGDVVSRKGSSYVAIAASPGPPPGTGWYLLAEKGKDGAKTVIYSGGGGRSDLYTMPQYDPTIAPLAVALNQAGVWREIPWGDFLDIVRSTPLPNQVLVNGVSVVSNGDPVLVSI